MTKYDTYVNKFGFEMINRDTTIFVSKIDDMYYIGIDRHDGMSQVVFTAQEFKMFKEGCKNAM